MSQWVGSPNYTAGRGGYKPVGVIIHWMDGNLASTDSVFQDTNRNTSAHYGVEDNNVHQYVREEDTAYQAGNWVVNEQTIGIEHSAQPGRDASDATYISSANLIAAAAKRWGFAINTSTVRPHNAIVGTQCPGTVDVGRLIALANQILGAGGAPASQATPPPAAAGPSGVATVTIPLLYVRQSPTSQSPLAGSQSLIQGQYFNFDGVVEGENVNGISTWLHSTLGHYVWAGGTDYPTSPAVAPPPPAAAISGGGTAEAVRPCNVRTAPNTSAPLGGSQTLDTGNTFQFTDIVTGESVTENGISSNQWYHSSLGHYVWAGNCKTI